MSAEEVVGTAEEFFEAAFPTYEIVRTLDVTLDPGVWHDVRFLAEAEDGTRKEAQIQVEESEDELEVTGVDLYAAEEAGDHEEEDVDNPVEKARQFFSVTYPSYEVVRTLDVELDPDIWHDVRLLVEADDGSREEAHLQVEETEDGFEVTGIDTSER